GSLRPRRSMLPSKNGQPPGLMRQPGDAMDPSAPAAAPFSTEESRPWAEIQAMQLQRLQLQLAYLAARSTFYQAKLKAARVAPADSRSLDDLRRIPLTTKQELRESLEAAPPLGLHRAAPLPDVVQVQASSGTTGSPAYVGLTRADRESWAEMTARGLYASGIRPGDTVLHAFSMSKG